MACFIARSHSLLVIKFSAPRMNTMSFACVGSSALTRLQSKLLRPWTTCAVLFKSSNASIQTRRTPEGWQCAALALMPLFVSSNVRKVPLGMLYASAMLDFSFSTQRIPSFVENVHNGRFFAFVSIAMMATIAYNTQLGLPVPLKK